MQKARSEVVVRRAKLADIRWLAEVHAASWRHAYQGIIPHLHLESMVRKRGAEWWNRALRSGENVLVVEAAGTVGGYATFGQARMRGGLEGEIYELYLDPVHQGLGLGELLFEACRHRLEERRLRGLLVWALLANTQAIEFYWRRGGRPVARAFDRIGGRKLEKIGFAWG